MPEQAKVFQEFVTNNHRITYGFFGDEDKKSTKAENRAELPKLLKEIDRRFPRIDDLYTRERLPQPRAVVIVWKYIDYRVIQPTRPTFVRIWLCASLSS